MLEQYAIGTYTLKALAERMFLLGLAKPDREFYTTDTMCKVLRYWLYMAGYRVKDLVAR